MNTRDGVTLLPDDREGTVEQIAQQLGLQVVGWIFTDLLSEDSSKGTVQHCRFVERQEHRETVVMACECQSGIDSRLDNNFKCKGGSNN